MKELALSLVLSQVMKVSQVDCSIQEEGEAEAKAMMMMMKRRKITKELGADHESGETEIMMTTMRKIKMMKTTKLTNSRKEASLASEKENLIIVIDTKVTIDTGGVSDTGDGADGEIGTMEEPLQLIQNAATHQLKTQAFQISCLTQLSSISTFCAQFLKLTLSIEEYLLKLNKCSFKSMTKKPFMKWKNS